MTRYLYETKLRDMRETNASLISDFADLQANLSNIQDDMEDLEEKD